MDPVSRSNCQCFLTYFIVHICCDSKPLNYMQHYLGGIPIELDDTRFRLHSEEKFPFIGFRKINPEEYPSTCMCFNVLTRSIDILIVFFIRMIVPYMCPINQCTLIIMKYILVKISKVPIDFVNRKCYRGQLFLDNNILNINYSILQTIIYTFFDKFNTGSCLNRYDKMRPLFFKIAPGHFRA